MRLSGQLLAMLLLLLPALLLFPLLLLPEWAHTLKLCTLGRTVQYLRAQKGKAVTGIPAAAAAAAAAGEKQQTMSGPQQAKPFKAQSEHHLMRDSR